MIVVHDVAMTQVPVDFSLRAGANPRPADWIEPFDLHDHERLAALAATSAVIWADIAEFQNPLDSSYPYPVISCRVDNGGRLDNHIGGNWAHAASNPKILIFIGYVVFIPGQLAGVMTRIKQVFGQRCPGKLVLRLDMESGADFAGPGNHSAEANQWHAAFAAYLATAVREDGYANGGDWAGLWPSFPAGLKRALADYTSSLPPGWYSYQYYGGLDYPTPPGLPRSCPPFGAWVDMNVSYRTIGQMLSDFGLATPPSPISVEDAVLVLFAPNGGIGEKVPGGKYHYDPVEWSAILELHQRNPAAVTFESITDASWNKLAEKRGRL